MLEIHYYVCRIRNLTTFTLVAATWTVTDIFPPFSVAAFHAWLKMYRTYLLAERSVWISSGKKYRLVNNEQDDDDAVFFPLIGSFEKFDVVDGAVFSFVAWGGNILNEYKCEARVTTGASATHQSINQPNKIGSKSFNQWTYQSRDIFRIRNQSINGPPFQS